MITEIIQGNTYSFDLRLRQGNGQPFELANCTFTLTARLNGSETVLIQTLVVDAFGLPVSSDGLTIGPGGSTAGIIVQTLAPADSFSLPTGWITWALSVEDISANVYTALCGSWNSVEYPSVCAVTGGVTLVELVRLIAQQRVDWIGGEATEDTGDAGTIKDDINFHEDTDYFRGCEVFVVDGPNAGSLHRCVGSDYGSQTISIDPPLAVPLQPGETFDLTNFRGNGSRRSQYKQIINRVIREIGDGALRPVSVPMGGMFTTGVNQLPIPPGITHVCNLEWLDASSGRWGSVGKATHRGKKGFFVDRYAGMITVDAWGQQAYTGKAIRLNGWSRHEPLNDNLDRTEVDSEWLVETASGMLQMASPDNDGNLGPGQYSRNRADAVRAKAITIIGPGCIKVR